MLLHLTELSSEPLHSQISRQLRAKILAGELGDGEPLPSIRSLTRELRVSVITVQRAYNDLEREGLVNARQGKGFFVLCLDAKRRVKIAEERFSEALEKLVGNASAEGLAEDQLRRIFDRLLDQAE